MIIGISGRKQSGKTSCVAALLEQGGFMEVNFADELKMLVVKGFGAELHQVCGSDKQKEEKLASGLTARATMQKVGEGMRAIDQNVWINFWRSRIDAARNELGCESFAVGDVRYPNEVAEIHRQGGVVIRLRRKMLIDSHRSETALDPYDVQWEKSPRTVFDDGVYFDEQIDNRDLSVIETQRAFIQLCEDRGWV